ncbi:MAG: hypothetical protein IMF11_10345, partial [Proteobacteria bacterium]|nr:hypothetical protein [Pseudomonadota bacterium]
MKNIVTIVLSLVLAAAIIFGLVLYGKYADTKDALLISEEKLSELNEKVIQLDQETSALNDQIEKNTERFKELENAKERAVELENTIKVKNQGLLSFEERLHDLGRQLEEEKKAKAAIETELSYRDATTTELQEKLESSQSRILYLEGEIAEGKGEIEEIQHQLSDIETEKAIAVSKLDQLKSSYDAN